MKQEDDNYFLLETGMQPTAPNGASPQPVVWKGILSSRHDPRIGIFPEVWFPLYDVNTIG